MNASMQAVSAMPVSTTIEGANILPISAAYLLGSTFPFVIPGGGVRNAPESWDETRVFTLFAL
jgi:hypothetical protein